MPTRPWRTKRFGSVTVLNGHIHQVVQKVEGKGFVPNRDADRLSDICRGQGSWPRPNEGSGRTAESGARRPGRRQGRGVPLDQRAA
jgi:hypothetical protein